LSVDHVRQSIKGNLPESFIQIEMKKIENASQKMFNNGNVSGLFYQGLSLHGYDYSSFSLINLTTFLWTWYCSYSS